MIAAPLHAAPLPRTAYALRRRAARVGLLALALLGASCPRDPPERAPVVVLAVDGLEWSVLLPLLRSGAAPNLARLAERGTCASLGTLLPTRSPTLWTTVATGARPEDHGILSFLEVESITSDPKPDALPYTSNTRRLPALWNVCGDRGRTALSVGWWVSWPAEHVPGARIVASYAAQKQANVLWKAGVWAGGLDQLTYPPGLADELAPLLSEGVPDGPLRAEFDADFDLLPSEPEWAVEHALDTNLRFSFHGDRTHQRIFLRELERGVADLNLLYVGLVDVAGHFFWRYREPSAYRYPVPPPKVEALGDRIDRSYRTLDRWVGEIAARLPDDALILIVSDHGMHAARLGEPKHFASGGHDDGPPGVFIASGPGIAATGLPDEVPPVGLALYDVFPTILALLGLPIPDDAPGQPRTDLMTAEWNAAHPLERIATYATGFRPATRPLQPNADANRAFVEGMKALGYF